MISSRQKLPILYLGRDLLTLLLTFLIAVYFFSENIYPQLVWINFLCFILLWFIIGYWRKLYYIDFSGKVSQRVINYVKAYIVLVGFVWLVYSFFPVFVPDKKLVVAFLGGVPVLGVTVNFLLKNVINLLPNNPKMKNTLVAGVGKVAENVEQQFYRQHTSRQRIMGFMHVGKKEVCMVEENKVVGNIKSINEYLRDHSIDEIVVAIPVKISKKIQDVLSAADYHGVRVKYVLDYRGLFGADDDSKHYGQLEAINVRKLPLDEKYAFFIKNSFDKVFAALALLLLMPFFLVLALLIKLDSPGPLFYCPIRIGRGGRPFKMFKFRSMRENDDASSGVLSTQKDDPRISRIGRIMRKYSIDELPQFFNVLLGDMSVVGPRPHRSFLNQQLQASVNKYMVRHYLKPGITGWAQVNGWRGPTDTEEQRLQRTRHDLWYMENWSLALDIKIIYRTIFSRKVHKNAF